VCGICTDSACSLAQSGERVGSGGGTWLRSTAMQNEPSTRSDEVKSWLAGVFDRAAASYDEVAGGYHEHFGGRLVALAGIGAGDDVLDVACGRGAALVPAARAVAPTGRAVGVDLSPEMVRLARDALGEAGLAGDARQMDAEHLAFDGATFGAVLCGFGVFFLPDPLRAVAGFREVLRPGGVVGISTWGADDPRWSWEDELLADVQVPRRALVRPFDSPGELRELLTAAGFEDITVHVEEHQVRLADAEEWWAWKWSYSLRGVLEQLPPARLARMRRDAATHLARIAEPDGLPLRLQALVAIARRPRDGSTGN
jgi:SAM-dependent methyltransferase